MQPQSEERRVRLLLFLTDLLLYAVALRVAALSILDTLASVDPVLLERDRMVCLLVFGATAFSLGCFDPRRIIDRFDGIYYPLLAVGLSLVLELALATLLPPEMRVISRRELVLSVPVAAVLLFLWRSFAAGFITRFRSLHRRFYVMGSEGEGLRIARAISADQDLHADGQYITYKGLCEKVRARNGKARRSYFVPEDAIIEITAKNRSQVSEMLSFCEDHFERVFLYPSLDDLLLFDHGKVLAIAGIPLVEVGGLRPAYPYMHIKRLMDIAVAGAGLLLASPICLVTALLIKVTSPGPVLYAQERLGQGGRPFRIYKFRSMVADVQKVDSTGHVLAEKGDARITPVGRFIRKHRVDEIPQLFNVLKGDMSLIGPRPVWKEYYEVNRKQLPLIDLRLAVRPGLTSLSHVLGSYTSEPRDRLRYDLVYIGTLSFLTDMRIMIETVRIVLSGKGAQ